MVRPILRYGHPLLSRAAAPVADFGDALRTLVADMIETMYAAPGVGLAAPQVGVPLRVSVIDVKGQPGGDVITLVNPEFVERDGMQIEDEGCLSLPGFTASVARPAHVVVRALDLAGTPRLIEGVGLLARALQHEIDHLNGRLFLDRVRPIRRAAIVRRIHTLERDGQW